MTKVAASPRNLASSTALRPRAFSITPPQQTEEYFENRGLTGLKAATKGMPGEDVLSSFKSFEERFPAEFIKWAEGADADPIFKTNDAHEENLFHLYHHSFRLRLFLCEPEVQPYAWSGN